MNRSNEPQLTTPIVPEPDGETVTRHRSPSRHRRRAKTGALWLICLVLLAALVTMGVYYWFDRQEWQAKQRNLDGQLSNLHARFDSLDDSQQSNELETQLSELTSKQQSLDKRQQELTTLLQTLQERTGNADPEAMAERLDTAKQERDTLSATLDAMGRSLTILEQSGDKARAAIETQMKDADEARDDIDQRLQTLAGTIGRLENQTQALSEQEFDKTLTTLQDQMEGVASRIEALEKQAQQQQTRFDELNAVIESNRSSLRELRQGQLALSASVENLRTRIE
ncbi:hypothetical protein ACPF7Z_03480 [Halomonas sp. GXIMD04776]|uniref:hypothetical protein n=1 Tax=Halomonas sp. GXIMD04776 TaxID=3415605 RepID=UPI003CAA1D6F